MLQWIGMLMSTATPNTNPTTDPITAFFDHDWSSVGGWSLFVSIVMFITIGSFREWWVPGPRAKRSEQLILSQQALIKQQSDQISKLTESNEFTKYVMQQVVPRPLGRDIGSTVARRPYDSDDEGSSS